MKKIILIFLVIFCSCSEKHINFTVRNSSGTDIDSAEISGLGSFKINQIKNNDEVIGYIDWSKSKSKTDGGYQIKIYSDNINRQYNFGYYSNGSPMTSEFTITIQKDTINVKETIE